MNQPTPQLNKLIYFRLKSAINYFEEQYGNNQLQLLKQQILKNQNVLEYLESLDRFNQPTAEDLMETCIKVEYINEATYLVKFTFEEYEKKLDFLYYGSLMILEYWLQNYVQKFDFSDYDEMRRKVFEDHSWYNAGRVKDRLEEIYDELERGYKSK